MPKKRDHGQGGLYRIRGGTMWRGVVELEPDPETGKRRQKYVHAKTQRACKDKLEEAQREIAEHGAPLDKTTTVAAWAPRWLEEHAKPNLDPNTFETYAGSSKWIVRAIGTKRLSALKPSDVIAVRDTVVAAGRSTGTARQAYFVLSMMLEAAKAERLTPRNVAEDVKPPKRTPTTRGEIPMDDALRILASAAAMPSSAGSRWWASLLTGMRQGEVLGATIADLDLESGVYEVAWKLEEISRDHGCGDKTTDGWPCGYKQGARCPEARWREPDGFEKIQVDGRWHLTRPKSEKGWRVVPIIPQLAEAIRRWLMATKDWPNPHGLIWRHQDGSPIMPREDAQQWRDLLYMAGVIREDQTGPGGTELTGHWARHTTVTVLASLGVDVQIIGEIVGHSSAQVTAIYRHARQSEKRAAMEALGGVWADALTLPALEPGE